MNNEKNKGSVNTVVEVGEILIIISAIFWCCTIIGMIWGIPMIIGCKKRMKKEMEITTSHIVISFLFFGWIGAILLLVGLHIDN